MKTLRQKIEEKVEKEYSELESAIKWLNVRRFISGAVIALGALAMYAAGADAGLVFFLFFVLPGLVIYGLQTIKLQKMKEKISDLEAKVLSGKEWFDK